MSFPARNLLLVFAKYPQAGIVKTRLGQKIGFEQAAQLYHAFLADLAPRFIGCDGNLSYDIRWVFIPRSSTFIQLVSGFLNQDPTILTRTSFMPYDSSDLLCQQIEQFTWAWENGYEKVVGIATDTPHLPVEYVSNAFRRLSDFDIVIGPTLDGGFYLLGSRAGILPQREIAMSTGHVLEDLLKIAKISGYQTFLLPSMLDIDLSLDLVDLKRLLELTDADFCPKTRIALQSILLDLEILDQ